VNEPNLVILAGGVSSRMKKNPADAAGVDADLLRQAKELPKSLITAGPTGRPLMDYLLFNAREAGYRDIVIVVGEQSQPFREFYGLADRHNAFHGLSISYAVQRIPEGRKKPLGTADAVQVAVQDRPDWHGQQFTVCNSDNLYSISAFTTMLNLTDEGGLVDYDRDALQCEPSRINAFAVIKRDGLGYVVDIVEKPDAHQLAAAADENGRLGVSMNIFRFSYDAIARVLESVPLHPVRLEKELPTAVRMMIGENPKAIKAILVGEFVPDLTHPEDIAKVREYLDREYPNFTLERS